MHGPACARLDGLLRDAAIVAYDMGVTHRIPLTGLLLMLSLSFAGFSCNRTAAPGNNPAGSSAPEPIADLTPGGAADAEPATATAFFAGGCFWCTEAVFLQLQGVMAVTSGYSGGSADSANYRAVSAGLTDHAETIRITYDPQQITYAKLLKVFFTIAHDPTQLNRQGADVGRHYRSAVFFQSPEEKAVVESYIQQLTEADYFKGRSIVTSLEPFEAFYEAEDYHQNYAANNPDQPYIRATAEPKVQKLRQTLPDRVTTSP